MAPLSFDKQFLCPYCGSLNDISVDRTAGKRCKLVTDCETCCRPIVVEITFIGEDCEIDARAENE
ncbi:MAG: CPXCG motif-containing cysteine-rich protein [Candidatus Omnitrophota bacterium]|nr:CPXCG motif-containing cysteine-rich protein [Candidatus Omnitrophota bacterium]